MRRAVALAQKPISAPHPNPRVGCVIVKDGRVVAEGFHQAAGSAHAEAAALDAGQDVRGGTMFITMEPCSTHGRTPPCVERILAAAIDRVVIASPDPNPVNGGLGIQRLHEAGVETEVGLLDEEARAINRGFFSRHERARPWVVVKTAATLDGRISTASGESQWITGDAARQDVQRLRAQAAAVVSGVGTVLADDPRLNCRLDGALNQPLRVIVDSRLRTPADARLFAEDGDILFAVGEDVNPEAYRQMEGRAEIVSFGSSDGRVDCDRLFRYLAEREINEALVEAGPTLAGELLDTGLADEMIVYLAPAILGDSAVGMARLPEAKSLMDWHRGRFANIQRFGDDVRIDFALSQSCGDRGD